MHGIPLFEHSSPRTRARFSENQTTPKLENRKTSPCSPCAPNLLHVLPSQMVGWNELCNSVFKSSWQAGKGSKSKVLFGIWAGNVQCYFLLQKRPASIAWSGRIGIWDRTWSDVDEVALCSKYVTICAAKHKLGGRETFPIQSREEMHLALSFLQMEPTLS